MKKILWIVLPWVAILATVAHAGHKVEVLETYPPGDRVELGPGQEFHLRLAYSTDPVARIFARPYLDGRQVHANTSPSPAYRGKGETTAWFSFADVDDSADEVRIFVGNNSGLKKPMLVYRVSIVGRSEEHTSELQSLMRISYAVFCLKKKNNNVTKHTDKNTNH